MDIRRALTLLTNGENNKYFKDQVKHFHKEQRSPLKEYIELVNKDPVQWLRSLPKGIKSKSTFHKYKAPLYVLLENEEVNEEYGESYCVSVIKNIKDSFKENIDNIINERKNTTTSGSDSANKSLDFDNPSDEEDSVLDLNNLEVANTTCQDDDNCNNDIQEEYAKLKKSYELMKVRLEYTERELSRVWELVHKMASK